MTIPKRYEITDEQWQRIESLFPPYSTAPPPKLTNQHAFNDSVLIVKVVLLGEIYRNVMDLGKPFIVGFEFGQMPGYLKSCFGS